MSLSSPSEHMGTVSKKFGLSNTLPQIFYLVAAFVLIIASCVFLDNKLPEPLLASELKESGKTGAFSEELASEHLFYLAGEVGLRPTGTENEVKSYEYIIKTLEGFKANLTNPHVKQFDILLQDTYGSHKISIAKNGDQLDSSFYDPDLIANIFYRGIKNVVARLSCGEECNNSLLLNTHYDSTISTLGAGDSAVAAAAMLELVRVYAQGGYELKNSLVLVWNGAEETLFDGSHGFISNYEHSESIKALINMDAIGTIGGEVLFQANSDLMLHAYSGVPHPNGNTFCNDFFNSKLITSDTDFATFIGTNKNLNAVDLAIIKNAYFYHTLLDSPKNVAKGTLQNLGDNILHMVKYLLQTENIDQYKPGVEHFYYSIHKQTFIMIKWRYFTLLTLFVGCLNFFCVLKLRNKTADILSISPKKALNLQYNAIFYYLLSTITGAVSMVIFSAINCYIFNKPMSWYYPENTILVLAIPAFILGSFISQLSHVNKLAKLVRTYQAEAKHHAESALENDEDPSENIEAKKDLQSDEEVNLIESEFDGKANPDIGDNCCCNLTENARSSMVKHLSEDQLSYFASILTNGATSTVLSIASIILSYFHQGYVQFTLNFAFFSVLALLYELARSAPTHSNPKRYSMISHTISFLSLPSVVSEITSFTAILVPVSSIAGATTQIDILIFGLLSGILHLPATVLYPLYHLPGIRIKTKKKILVLMTLVFLILIHIHGSISTPYDETHPKRVYLLHVENKYKNENLLIAGFSDYGYMGSIIANIKEELGLDDGKMVKVKDNENIMVFHPFREFVKAYEFEVKDIGVLGLPVEKQSGELWVEVEDYYVHDDANIISCDLVVHHEGLVNLVIQVDATILSWSRPNFEEYLLHNKRNKYIYNDVSGYGISASKISFSFEPDESNPPSLTISGIVRDTFTKSSEVTSASGITKGALILDDSNPYSVMYHKLHSTLPEWTTPAISSAKLTKVYLQDLEKLPKGSISHS